MARGMASMAEIAAGEVAMIEATTALFTSGAGASRRDCPLLLAQVEAACLPEDMTVWEADRARTDVEMIHLDHGSCWACPGLEACGQEGLLSCLVRSERWGDMGRRTYLCRRARARRAEERLAKLLRHSRLREHFLKKTFENFLAPEGSDQDIAKRAAWRLCQAVARGSQLEPPGLVLVGDTGVGKTHLAAAIVNHLVGCEIVTVYQKVSQLLDALRPGGEGERHLDDLFSARLVVLDDLGAEYVKTHGEDGWVQSKLAYLLDTRYEAEAPVVITTNYPLEAIRERLGRRIASRLSQMCLWLTINGEDWRVKHSGGA